MRYRLDYVTNSSSSSFIISKDKLSENQIKAIHEHSKLGKRLKLNWAEESWDIEETENWISGYTYMDNFDFREFLNIIGVKKQVVAWDTFQTARDLENDEDDDSNWEDFLDEI